MRECRADINRKKAASVRLKRPLMSCLMEIETRHSINELKVLHCGERCSPPYSAQDLCPMGNLTSFTCLLCFCLHPPSLYVCVCAHLCVWFSLPSTQTHTLHQALRHHLIRHLYMWWRVSTHFQSAYTQRLTARAWEVAVGHPCWLQINTLSEAQCCSLPLPACVCQHIHMHVHMVCKMREVHQLDA